jgi:hypothetical protein
VKLSMVCIAHCAWFQRRSRDWPHNGIGDLEVKDDQHIVAVRVGAAAHNEAVGELSATMELWPASSARSIVPRSLRSSRCAISRLERTVAHVP